MAILSSKYGIVKAEEIIEPYEEVLTKQRAEELLPQVTEDIQDYDAVVYYRGGAGKEYCSLIKSACEYFGNKFFSTGFKNLGNINLIHRMIKLIE